MDMSIGKLRQLVAVARTGSFSRAAVELNISQPALSRSIAAIEDRYGFEFFTRKGHGVELTVAGTQAIAMAQSLLQTMQVFDNNLKLFGSGAVGTLSIGLAPLLASQLLARFAADFFAASNKAQLEVVIRPGAVLVDCLKRDQIELFFFPDGYIDADAEIEVEPVGSFLPVCVVRSGHPLAGRRNLAIEDLADFAWANAVASPLVEAALKPTQFICDNYHILRDAVLASDLICFCSAAFIAQQLEDGSLCEIHIDGLPLERAEIHSAKLRGRISSPLAVEATHRIRALINQGC